METILRNAVEPNAVKERSPDALSANRPKRRIAKIGLHLRDIMIGVVAAMGAVALRSAFNLPPGVLPFFTVIIAVCMVTVTTSLTAGVTAAIVGGVLSWYFILTPGSWTLLGQGAYALLGYLAVIVVILLTSQMYRVTERSRQEAAVELAMKEAEHQALFAREMSHRLKNAMAIVQAMANQSFAMDNPDLTKFTGRLSALAQAHGLLNEHIRQPSADVRELVEMAITPFRDRAERYSLDGPVATIPDQLVISLALALHELGTNAVKYGALSVPHGRVSIRWQMVDGKLRLDWQESGGPSVLEPTSTGFGTRLLRRTAMGAELKFEPAGLRCVISQRI